MLRQKANILNLNWKRSQKEPKLTSEDQQLSERRHKLVVFYPRSALKLVPQSAEGFIVQIKLCGTKRPEKSSGREDVSAGGGGAVTAGRNGLFQLLLRDRGGNPALVAFHVLPPDRRHKVLQFEDLRQIQFSRFVCLNVLVTRNNHNRTVTSFSQAGQLVLNVRYHAKPFAKDTSIRMSRRRPVFRLRAEWARIIRVEKSLFILMIK